ncbi:MAG: hypothetical protein DRH57_05325 [Candidatus Cloacimonadota bacterium]|nr:MAG: hypothetical protein DRH57_05325 [Candidatus Cloacimonadota bacterium]
MTGLAIASLIGTTASVGSSIYQADKQKDAAKDAAALQEKELNKAKQTATIGAAQQATVSYKQEQAAKREKAQNTAKITARKNAPGKSSLLTGTEAGSFQTIK